MANLSLKKNVYDWPLTTRMLVIGLVCAGVFYLGYQWDLVSLKSQLSTGVQQEQDLKQQLELVIKKQLTVKNEILKFTTLQGMLVEWQKKLSNYGELPQVLDAILKIGSNNQLHFTSFTPGAEVKENSYLKVPIKVVADGTYHQIGSFISQIANMKWIVVVNSITITKEKKTEEGKPTLQGSGQNLLTCELTLEVYHFAPNNQH